MPERNLLADSAFAGNLAPEAPLLPLSSTPSPPHQVFISGHSLVDLPFPVMLSEIAARAGSSLHWQRQYLEGSSISQRSPPQPLNAGLDALVITERHDLLGVVMWHDTQGQLKRWRDAMRAANPGATTYFFVPWLPVHDRNRPAEWIAYERAAAAVWQCVISRVNAGLQNGDTDDRIVTLPTNLALVSLIERLQSGADLPGVSAATPRASIDRIFADGVHLTPLGKFYMALVSFLGMSRMDPDALMPLLDVQVTQGVTPEQSRTLLAEAARFLGGRSNGAKVLAPEDCRRFLRTSFIEDYWRYARKAHIAPQQGWLRSYWSTWRMKRQSVRFFQTW
jgi:hypothetical protein